MSANRIRLSFPIRASAAALSTLACVAALAAPAADERAQYDKERAACNEGRSNQDRATCLKEANAAFAQARHGTLAVGSGDYAGNARRRCDGLMGGDRSDCMARMRGQGTTRGSVAKGGIYREIVTEGPVTRGSAAAVVPMPDAPAPPPNRP